MPRMPWLWPSGLDSDRGDPRPKFAVPNVEDRSFDSLPFRSGPLFYDAWRRGRRRRRMVQTLLPFMLDS